MSAESFIAGRLRLKQKMAVIATALSSFIIITATTVSSGFRHEIREEISRMTGDLIITGNPIDYNDSLLNKISSTVDIREANPVIYRAGIVKSGNNIRGVVFKGVQSNDSSMTAWIPSSLAASQGLTPGDKMTSYFIGDRMQVRKFTVAGISDNILDTGDNPVVLVPLTDMQRLDSWAEGQVTDLEIITSGRKDRQNLREASYLISSECGYFCTSSMEKYSRIFDWLDIIDLNVLIIIILMTIVAGFNMISGLLILLFRNTSTIGSLKSMGMTDKSISSVFIRIAAKLAARGMVTGNVLALLFCLIQGTTHVIRLNPENYFIPFVPVHVNLPVILMADIVSFAAIMLLMMLPTIFISKVDPAETIKSE